MGENSISKNTAHTRLILSTDSCTIPKSLRGEKEMQVRLTGLGTIFGSPSATHVLKCRIEQPSQKTAVGNVNNKKIRIMFRRDKAYLYGGVFVRRLSPTSSVRSCVR